MLLKFTSLDMLNTSLVNSTTGKLTYKIITSVKADSSTSSVSSDLASEDAAQVLRTTHISDPSGKILANIAWTGRRPDITIGDEKIGALTDLFEASSTKILFVIILHATAVC